MIVTNTELAANLAKDAGFWINQMHKRRRGWGICPRLASVREPETRDAGATLPEGWSQLGRTSRPERTKDQQRLIA